MANELAYIYLIQDGNDRDTDIYKIGRTSQHGDSRQIKRLSNYSKGTVVHNIWKVDPDLLNDIENEIKMKLKSKFVKARGAEWFEGNVHEMKKEIDTIINFHESFCYVCSNSRQSYWTDGLYGPCFMCTFGKCFPHEQRFFYNEDEPKSYCGNKMCHVYGCYMGENGKCLSQCMKEYKCDECNGATGFWDERDKWNYCKNCTNFNCRLCDGERYLAPGVVDDSEHVRLCILCKKFRHDKQLLTSN
jgi:hypothetical protein